MTIGTVVTTVFNGSRFCERYCDVVESALRHGVHLHWSLCDDGSSDDTIERLTREAGRRDLLAHIHVTNLGRMGRARALNAAVRLARSEHIFIHDFDDVSSPDRFAAQARMLDSDPRLACVGGGYEHVDLNCGTTETRSLTFDEDMFLRLFPLYVPFPHTFMAFRRSAVIDAGGYPEWDDYEEMGLLAALLDQEWKIASVPQVVGQHFIYKQSYFERQHGYSRRRWRNLRRQLAMKERYRSVKATRPMMLMRFAYNFFPPALKFMARRALGYAN